MKVTAFTACNEKFFPLLEGMLASLRDVWLKGIKRLDSFDVVVFANGLTPEQLEKAKDWARVVDVTDLDLSVHYPAYNDSLTEFPAAYAIRPFLPDFAFGKTDACIWIDADIWFQDKRALEDLIWALHYTQVAAVPVEGRIASYQTPGHRLTVKTIFRGFFGEESSKLFGDYPVLNMGFWGMKTSCPIWSLWEKNLNTAIKNSWGDLKFGVEESAFNYTIYQSEVPIVPLPYTHNCSIAAIKNAVVVKDGKLCVGMVPFEEISAVHLSYLAKWDVHVIPVLDTDGKLITTLHTKLDYPSFQSAIKEHYDSTRNHASNA